MMDSEEDRIRKQGQTDAAKKTGQIAARGVADYYTGGKYEQIRNAPVVGKVAQGAENTIGKVVGAADKLSGRKLGKVSKKLDDAGVLDTANDAIGTLGSIKGGGKNPQDVDALKNRAGVNKGVGRPSEFDEPGLSNSNDGLKEKVDEGALKDQAKEHDKIEKEKRQSERNQIRKGIEDKVGITEIRNKIKRTIFFNRIGLAVVAVIGIVIIFATIIVYLDSVADAVTNFFGVSEADIEDEEGNISTGFFTDDEYLFDENGNELSEEEAIGKLYANGEECKITIWTKIKDFFNFSKRFSDKCAFMRYVRTEAESNGVDTALIISSIMNGYGTQADQGDYIDNDYVPDDYVSSNEQYKSLEKILENKDFNINKDTIDDIVKYSVTKKTFFYYEFIEKNKATHEGECKKKIWYEYEYNLEKWKVFMRFGKTAATEFDRANYTFYLQERNDEECKNIQEPETYSDTFYQYADVDSKTKDVFTPYNGPYASVTFDYKNGYAYNQFPGFLTSINNSGTTI